MPTEPAGLFSLRTRVVDADSGEQFLRWLGRSTWPDTHTWELAPSLQLISFSIKLDRPEFKCKICNAVGP